MADSPDEHAARRTVVLLGLGLVLVLLGGAAVAIAQHRRDRDARATDVLPDSAVGTRATDIGPPVNTAVAAYVVARQQALATATGTHLAVVSLSRYATEADARHAVAPLTVVALVVAGEGGLPTVVRGELRDWVDRQRSEARHDFDDVHALVCSGTVDDAEFRSFYDTEQARLLALQSIDVRRPLVFAAVVRGAAADLQRLAKAPGVRLVDVGGGGHFDASSAYRGLRPEEVAITGQPAAYRGFGADPTRAARATPPCPRR